MASLPDKLRVAEIEEALEAWAMLTQDRIQREPRPEAELMAMAVDDLRQVAESLRAELTSRSGGSGAGRDG